MRKWIKGLAGSLGCMVIVIAGFIAFFPLQPAGVVRPGTGVYLGNSLLLSNQHVLRFQREGMIFKIPAWKYGLHAIDAPVEEVLYENRDIELAIARLGPSLLSLMRVTTPCLAMRPVKEGEVLEVTSDPHGIFPPVTAKLVVSDARPLMRRDLGPVPMGEDRYSATTILTSLSADQKGRVGEGSSGAPVLNSDEELVGLVWTGRELEDGSVEVWITPVSAWLDRIQSDAMPEDLRQALLDARCSR